MVRIFSGIQPTGDKHLGNYIGGFRQYAQTQEQGEAFFCIVDLHSITVDHDPRDLHDRTLDLFADVMLRIAREAREEPATVTGAPWTTPVSRLDEGRAARELKLTWKASAKT